LTTAAGIWLTAAIGVAAGMGREATAVFSTLTALVILYTVPKIARRFENVEVRSDAGTSDKRRDDQRES
jgi:putative Mg2+ transporter-C (MgtC) family protein